MLLEWLPPPVDFSAELRAAAAAADSLERLERLTALAQQRLDFLQTVQLDNALQKLRGGDAPAVRLAVLAASTVDHLLPAIRIAALRRGVSVRTYKGGFGQFRQELWDASSPLKSFAPEFVLLALGTAEAIAGVPLRATAEQAEQHVARVVEETVDLWRRARRDFGSTVIQQLLLDTAEPLFGSYDRLVPASAFCLVMRLNDRLAEAAAREGVLVLDVPRAVARHGLDAWFDAARWLQGKLEIAPLAATWYGDLVARLIAAQRGRAKKCLVLDLDNTLWGGVVGDDGLDGIRLGSGSAEGEAFLGMQRYAKALNERGVVLAVCSKNDPVTAERAFAEHPEMFLKPSDIAVFRANWRDKAENLREIAQRLNIGLDAMVFVDDNPAERARIRAALPMVAVPELPADPAFYTRRLADAGYFDTAGMTDDDFRRAHQYAANAEREALRETAQTLDDYLRSLAMSVTFGEMTPADLPRVTQLINKTNQFNTTARRYSAEELSALAAAPGNVVLQFRLLDRFGDNGLVSVAVLQAVPEDSEELAIASWVMSCRVFGRQLEDEVMNIIVETARRRGTRALRGIFVGTERNAVIEPLYERLGFARDDRRNEQGSCWILATETYAAKPTFISRVEAKT